MAHNKHPADAKFINSRTWRDWIRAKQLRDHPLCEDCRDQGRTTLATTVDHVIVPNGDPHAAALTLELPQPVRQSSLTQD